MGNEQHKHRKEMVVRRLCAQAARFHPKPASSDANKRAATSSDGKVRPKCVYKEESVGELE